MAVSQFDALREVLSITFFLKLSEILFSTLEYISAEELMHL
jgi:hypothetical protein